MCGCELHHDRNARCTCRCPNHEEYARAHWAAVDASSAPGLWTGDDGTTSFLLTRWPDGSVEIATRPTDGGTRAIWSPPIALTEVSA